MREGTREGEAGGDESAYADEGEIEGLDATSSCTADEDAGDEDEGLDAISSRTDDEDENDAVDDEFD